VRAPRAQRSFAADDPPGFERLPILGRDGDDPPLQDIDLRGLERFAPDEIAQARPRLLGSRLQQGALLVADAQMRL
jgi:hypothetical protein